ncbi:Lrp/AsnC family transcriptional regulator [Leifsonia sp. Root112D2]|jgi:DNA-binding Lrp family transcriptional regulator|uniref:Lrp/AsnC family transcriptional regulator n=1 Tax=Leifsonia sp. Root112D2 TaxID=1736426 RepID=UPI000700E2E7|nr:Lrp/AsnC family transcriptional regulator [Leifsonia sp. Root112D2]KQV07260.1 AsnC family transcriptional regulator [Leifsonia sp. Root112D2]
MCTVPTLDATDRRILLALEDDPRVPVVLLAQRLGLARGTVQSRLERLASDGTLLPNSVRVPPDALGRPMRAIITAELDQTEFPAAMDSLAQIAEVLECAAISGESDLFLQVVARDPDDMYRVSQEILACPGIRRTSTSLVLRDLIPFRTTALLGQASAG